MAEEAKPCRETAATYSLGAVVRLTGLSPHVLRAWERRYAAVTPLRTTGGTRRYRESDVVRLKLLAAAVAAGHPIGDIAQLPMSELRRRGAAVEAERGPQLHPILDALERLDADETERLLGLHLVALGPRRFVETVMLPLLRQIGERWSAGRFCIASEHLASSAIRSLLGNSLRFASPSRDAPIVLFTTLPGDRHELGVLACAVIAAYSGVNVIVLGISNFGSVRQRERALRELHQRLPGAVALWIGGGGSEKLQLPAQIERVPSIESLAEKISLLAFRSEPAHPG
jgi:DNA-binding transcriptional MerR regulator